ncbi:hypothetical protein Pla52o_10740 [Novipirellula galeiformis]|uniref:DUF4254 domain-containing protein n=1 Tax=Novipirellula galeiformis TaxID=2528004 RepID=A0A5C6CRN3_9BACT|nr:DUF4254 domain-containing protein [Novipirellula galeiformis]TWU27210.1 hypothetical protein Pla52o_10740 [Novipirellula galeiformis]
MAASDHLSTPNVAKLTQMQIDAVRRWHAEPVDNRFTGLEGLVCQQHAMNFCLWHEEDKARNPAATDVEIAGVKRAIDGLNQRRNDLIEDVDDAISELIRASGITVASDAAINTETPGSVIDRLSIMSLRIFHYGEQCDRMDVEEEHRKKVLQRLAVCKTQHADLSFSLQQLFDDLFAGRKRHQTYRQLKMYNDASLNPAIYNASRQS